MSKPFQTHNKQLKILRSRNLIVKDGSKAKSILIRENYYQLINGYKNIFLDIVKTKQLKNDYFKTGTTFEQIYALYEFDRNIRHILLKYMLICENSLKAKIAYHFSSQHIKEPFPYLNINNFQTKSFEKSSSLIALLSDVTKNNTDAKNKSGPFFHYFHNHKELPLWVLVTKLSLGQTCNLFYNLSSKIQSSIIDSVQNEFKYNSNQYHSFISSNYIDDFSKAINTIKAFRNMCAHEGKIYDYIAKNKNGKAISTSFFYLSSPPAFSGNVYSLILLLRFFLSKKHYKDLIRLMMFEITDLGNELPPSIFSEVVKRMGFPKDWKTSLKQYI